MSRTSQLLIVASVIINCAIVAMLYTAIYSPANKQSSFFQDFIENTDLYIINFINPLLLSIACLVGLFFSNNNGASNKFWTTVPLAALILVILVSFLLSSGIGVTALSYPFVFLAWLFTFKIKGDGFKL